MSSSRDNSTDCFSRDILTIEVHAPTRRSVDVGGKVFTCMEAMSGRTAPAADPRRKRLDQLVAAGMREMAKGLLPRALHEKWGGSHLRPHWPRSGDREEFCETREGTMECSMARGGRVPCLTASEQQRACARCRVSASAQIQPADADAPLPADRDETRVVERADADCMLQERALAGCSREELLDLAR